MTEGKSFYEVPVKNCPKCGHHVYQGYGLAGGGIGLYEYCSNDECDYFVKWQDPELDDVAEDFKLGDTE